MKKNFESKLLKTLIIFLCYFIYTKVTSSILSIFNITNNIIISFVADIIYLIFITYMYRNNLKKDFNKLKDNKFSKNIKTILIWLLILFVCNVIIGILTGILPDDQNAAAITSLFEISTVYLIFKSMIFAVFAEELLYRESLREVISNKYIFIFVSAIIYTLMIFIFTGFESSIIIIDILSYFLPALVFSSAYVKNEDNIVLIMIIKFIWNLIPTLLLFTI